MKQLLSERAAQLKPSATLAISAKEKELKSQGVDVIGFGAGEPDFTTPLHIREAAIRSLNRGETFYTPVGGTTELKKAVISRFSEDYGLVYSPDEILVSCGAKHSLYNIFQAILGPGDEVLVFAPYWVSYPEMIALAGGTPVVVPTTESNGFVPDPEQMESLITSRTKAILVNSPSNPTGTVYPQAILDQLAQIAQRHDLLVISDEIYDKLIYDNTDYSSFACIPGMRDRTVVVNGVSKTYAMTGLRIGYLACPRKELVKAATDIQSQSTSNPSNTAQAAAVEALTGPQDEVVRMRGTFRTRRDLMVAEINAIPEISVMPPSGAFYAFVNTSQLCRGGRISDSAGIATYLLERCYVACVPGGPFGSSDHIRLSFATNEETILEGMKRIRAACQELV